MPAVPPSRAVAALAVLVLIPCLSSCKREFQPLVAKAAREQAKGDQIEAIDKLNLALTIWKESDGKEGRARAYELLGKAYQATRQSDKAIEAYEQAIELGNDVYDAAYQLGVIYMASSKHRLALRAFQRALQIRKDDPLSLVGLGNAYYGLRDYRNALLAYQRVLDTSPGVNEAIEYKALALRKLRRRR